MVTPIYNEPACSQAACHAHPADMNVLGVLDVALDLDPVDREVANVERRTVLVTGIQVILIGLFIIFATRHFVGVPIAKLIEGTRAISAMQLDKSVEINTSEELAELARSFNLMRERLAKAINETSRVGRIVSDLLAFSRRSKPHSTNADLNAIVKTTLSLLSHKLKLSNVEVVKNLEDNLPHVRCDSSQMQQVVINLVMNGAESTHNHEQGRLWINTRSDRQHKTAILEVKDNGEGIAPENLPKIFDPFFTTKGEGKGVGLGLSVVYGIVDAHGGDIEVKSKVSEGTTFIVTLPLFDETEIVATELNATGHAA
jgi:two-component system NtrC family sensor kinase